MKTVNLLFFFFVTLQCCLYASEDSLKNSLENLDGRLKSLKLNLEELKKKLGLLQFKLDSSKGFQVTLPKAEKKENIDFKEEFGRLEKILLDMQNEYRGLIQKVTSLDQKNKDNASYLILLNEQFGVLIDNLKGYSNQLNVLRVSGSSTYENMIDHTIKMSKDTVLPKDVETMSEAMNRTFKMRDGVDVLYHTAEQLIQYAADKRDGVIQLLNELKNKDEASQPTPGNQSSQEEKSSWWSFWK